MRISISSHFTSDGKEYYEWDLWAGPADCSDHAHGYAVDLVTAFSKLLEWNERIVADYATEIAQDLETLKNFLSNDETN